MPIATLPSLGALQALVALSRSQSLSAAAIRLGVTRSALSHRIADLESQLGVALVQKSGRRIVPTDDGQALIAAMGDALDRIEAAIGPIRRQRAQVRISTATTFASNWLIPRLPEFQARYPTCNVAISTTTRVVDLATEDFDGAIRHGLGQWDGLLSVLLFRETLVPVAAAAVTIRLTGAARQPPWKGLTLIHARSRALDWSVWWKASGLRGSPPEGGIIVENRALALEVALAGAGIALVDAAYVKQHVAEDRLRVLAQDPIRLRQGYYFVQRPRSSNGRMITAFRDWLVESSRCSRDNES